MKHQNTDKWYNEFHEKFCDVIGIAILLIVSIIACHHATHTQSSKSTNSTVNIIKSYLNNTSVIPNDMQDIHVTVESYDSSMHFITDGTYWSCITFKDEYDNRINCLYESDKDGYALYPRTNDRFHYALGYEGDDMIIIKISDDNNLYKYKGLDEQYHILIKY